MLALFRRNLFSNIILLFCFCGILHGVYFFLDYDSPAFYSPYPFLESINGIFDHLSSRVVISSVIIFLQAMLLSRMVIIHRLSRELSLIPGAVFILYCLTILESQVFDYIIVANLFFLLSLNSLFKLYKKYKPIGTIFNAGFWLGIAVMIYFPYAIFFISLIFGLINLRNFDYKEFLQLLLGFLCSIFLAGVAFYFFDLLEVYKNYLLANVSIPSFSLDDTILWIKPGLLLITILLLIVMQNSIRKKKKYDAIRKIELTYSLLLLSALSLFFSSDLSISHLIICSVPIGILGGLIMEKKDNHMIKEVVFIVLIGLFLILPYNLIQI